MRACFTYSLSKDTNGFGLELLPHRPREFLEVPGFAEILIDAGEADIGDRVERFQALHHQRADPGRGGLALAARLDLALDRGSEALDPLGRDGAFAAGDGDRALQLAPIEGLAPLLGLDHDQLAKLHP